MTTVIFIHGTGVRGSQYDATFKLIQDKFKQIQRVLQLDAKRSDINVVPCLWGDTLGTKLNAKGASIPQYEQTLAIGDTEPEDTEIILWEQLYRDPLFELRLLSLQTTNTTFAIGIELPGDLLSSRVEDLATKIEIKTKLEELGITEIFTEAHQRITHSDPYYRVLKNASEPLGEYGNVIARAIIAQTILDCEQKNIYMPILTNAELRDELVKLLSDEVAELELGFRDWVDQSLLEMGLIATNQIQKKRGYITTNPYSFMPCDILLYQGRGEQIRKFIQETIEEVQPPVVLLAHSLGGIACVDLLVENAIKEVALLVTVGSQAPFLYEINALHSLAYGQPLPEHFPHWLNIFDLRDFLSYIGENIFPNRVQDERVDNNLPFPQSHSAYWTNELTWDEIKKRLPQ